MSVASLFAGTQLLVISGKRNSQDSLRLQPQGLISAEEFASLEPDKDRPEVLFAPFPMTDGNAMPSIARAGDGGWLVWCDVDHRLMMRHEEWVEKLDAWALESGTPGRRQVFVRLDRATPAHHVEALNRALCEKLDGDESKISRAAIMRLPAGFNTKGGKRRSPRIVRDSETVWSAPDVASALGTELPDTDTRITAHAVSGTPTAIRKSDPRYQHVRNKIRIANQRFTEGRYKNRHILMFGLGLSCIEAGVGDPSELLWVMEQCDAAVSKCSDEGKSMSHHVGLIMAKAGTIGPVKSEPEERAGVRDEPAVTSADDAAAGVRKVKAPRRPKSRFLSRQELRDRPEPQWLIERLIPEYGIGQLFGPTYGGKTYAAVDLVMRITTGMGHWIGHTIKMSGAVFYVLMEGGFDFGKRLDAWELKYGRTSDELYVMVEEELNLADAESLEQLAEDVTAVSSTPRLLVIDTQSLAIRGVDENDNTGMNEVMQRLKALSKALGCFVLLVHHTGHANGDRGRGASAQPAALDTIIRINGSDKDGRKIAVPKVKAGREVKERDFRLEEQKNGWPAFVEMSVGEALLQNMTNEDKIINYLKWNGPLTPPQIAEGIEGIAESTARNLCAAMSDPEKCPRGEKPKLVIVHVKGRSKFYDVADHLKSVDRPDPADL
ncbi:AAA family ATPase [Streptomyces sp. NPDC057623]|uniref:AAA family ATPase n=1 Tax=Streptomyces sp. NPDC057623 TaxID=3346187 RepID=UPI0036B1B816